MIKRLNLVLDGWGRYFKCGYPSRQFAKVNAYARYRLYKFLNRKSQRRYRLKASEGDRADCGHPLRRGGDGPRTLLADCPRLRDDAE